MHEATAVQCLRIESRHPSVGPSQQYVPNTLLLCALIVLVWLCM